ncbi:hypothetical protein PCH70_13300 [Pseudomonas cichorii JBC1]|nr:hypothetical protein PCH70_13300 [Pseudomonas cichorii JBC1]
MKPFIFPSLTVRGRTGDGNKVENPRTPTGFDFLPDREQQA